MLTWLGREVSNLRMAESKSAITPDCGASRSLWINMLVADSRLNHGDCIG
jgi:hypothetical protein